MENENKNKKSKKCWIAIIVAFLVGLIVDLVVNRFGGYKAVSSKAVNAVKNIGGSKNVEAPVQQPQPQYNPQPQQAQQGYNNYRNNGGKFNNNYNNK